MSFNPTIDLGTIISIAAVVIGIMKITEDLAVIKFKVDELWKWKKDEE